MLDDHIRLHQRPTEDISLEAISYSNDRVGGLVTNIKSALDWLFANLYNQSIGTFATPADLPASADANSYAFVTDDGDGKSSGYVFIDLDGSSSWQKKYDVDWNVEGLLSDLVSQTNPLYAFLNGRDGGQSIYGGTENVDELHLHGSAHVDKTKIVIHDEFIPDVHNDISIGELTKQIKDLFIAGAFKNGTIELTLLELKAAYDHISLTDNPHSVSYDQLISKIETLTLDGHVTGSVNLDSSGDKTLTVNINNDSHTHSKTTLPNFDDDVWEKLKSSIINNDIVTYLIDDTLQTIKPVIADISTARVTDIDTPSTKHKIVVTSPDETKYVEKGIGVEMSGDIEGVGTYDVDTEKISITPVLKSAKLETINEINYKNLICTIGAHATDSVVFAPSHKLKTGLSVHISSTNTTPAIDDIYAVNVIDADNFSISETITEAGSGFYIPDNAQLLYSVATQKWITRREFEEVILSELGGLDEDVLLQYVNKNGRITGQTIHGGIDANEDLTLESTTHATKGFIVSKGTIIPFDTATYSGSWAGIDLGKADKRYRNLYLAGQVFGLRLEKVTANPPSSVQTVGRLVWNEVDEKAYIDTGVEYKLLSGSNPPAMLDTFAGVEVKAVDLSSVVEDVADFNWLLLDDATSEIIHAKITRTGLQEITVNVDFPLTGTYKIKAI